MEKQVFAIGHITNDLEPVPHIGGAVTYTGVGLKRLGYETHIITKYPGDGPFIKELADQGIFVYTLPVQDDSRASTVTAFKNFYDTSGHREQEVSEVQETITQQDLPFFPVIPKDAIILIAPVISEVDSSLIADMSEKGHVIVTPQGYLRKREPDGKIRRVSWENVDALSESEVVMFSDEDLTVDGVFNGALLEKIRDICPLAVMTQGSDGATIFQGVSSKHFSTFLLTSNELQQGDFTGAGDTCTAGFIANYFQTQSPEKAILFGMLYAALKIAGVGGKGLGIAGIPTREQVLEFERQNPERIKAFLKENGIVMQKMNF